MPSPAGLLTKETFLAQIEHGIPACPPVTAAMLSHLSAELKKGDPPWWLKTRKAWEKRPFVAWNEAWTLFMTAVHYEVLSRADHPLVPYFPSCGGTGEADPSGAFAKFLASAPDAFYENLRTRERRVYVPLRSLFWLGPAAMYFHRRKLSYYLVELNAGGGLNLAADHLVAPQGFDATFIAARIGLDPRPLQLDDMTDRRWMTAAIFPENLPAIGVLDKAIDAVGAACREDATFIQLAPCPVDKAARFIAKSIPHDDAGVGLLIYNMGVTARMADADYAAFSQGIAEALAPWGDRGLWVEVEHVRGELYSFTYQLLLQRLVDGALRQTVMASVDLEAGRVTENPRAPEFLAFTPKPKK